MKSQGDDSELRDLVRYLRVLAREAVQERKRNDAASKLTAILVRDLIINGSLFAIGIAFGARFIS